MSSTSEVQPEKFFVIFVFSRSFASSGVGGAGVCGVVGGRGGGRGGGWAAGKVRFSTNRSRRSGSRISILSRKNGEKRRFAAAGTNGERSIAMMMIYSLFLFCKSSLQSPGHIAFSRAPDPRSPLATQPVSPPAAPRPSSTFVPSVGTISYNLFCLVHFSFDSVAFNTSCA